jgi:hypothetical protein
MKLPLKIHGKTLAFFERNIVPKNLFITVMCGFPAFLFQRSTAILAIEILVFFSLSLFRRGRTAILSPFLILCFITFFNLFTPYGKILFRIGTFAVTDGALFQGLRRAEILIGMVFLSQFALDPHITLAGGAGKFLSQMFVAFNRITAEKIPLNPRQILVAIDNRLFDSYFTDEPVTENAAIETAPQVCLKTTALGWTLLVGFLASLYGALGVSFFL